ncbi:MAG: BamA/TamA family outer membrane protein [Bacteroides sp.]|nr:BamA/TamA family outer membrane protein [Bacteroides sp.]MCM1413278.1 BamA/TamA family outer membrane protein [Bacteroides sp.]MCM1471412.1 BamA/TamA family outer membrane protein [Bacteroides sp.]
MRRKTPIILSTLLLVLVLWACSSTRHVPQGSLLLDRVDIEVDDSSGIDRAEMANYLRQMPNHKVLGFAKLQLGLYNMSGSDSSRWYNRWLRRLGQPPVIYDPTLTENSRRQLTQAMINKGYMDATVVVDTMADTSKRKMKVTYELHPGDAHVIRSISYEIPDTTIRSILMADTSLLSLTAGDRFDRNALDQERTAFTNRMRQAGYYAFAKEYITFIADTAENSLDVDLTMVVRPPMAAAEDSHTSPDEVDHSHHRYTINRVIFVAGGTTAPRQTQIESGDLDSVYYRGITVLYPGDDHYILPSILDEKCFIRPGEAYNPRAIDRTYEALSQLSIIKSINIEMDPVGHVDGQDMLDAYIVLTRNKKQGVTLELEGTNSEGDFGFGVGVAYQHRNLAHRSNLLTTKFRVNYESLSGNLSNLINDRYTEYAAEVGITFPKFMMPFLSRSYKQRIKASTELATSFNYQERPEYTRVIAGAAWKYKWTTPDNRIRRTWDLVDINYVYLPESTIDFINQIAPSNPLLRYSYEDHFIMRMGYTINMTNKQIASNNIVRYRLQPYVYTLRASAETAGNLLYAISSLTGQHRDDGVYKLFGIQYSQYAKAEIDYSLTRNISQRHALAFHVGFGIGVPYGNSRVLPFEKRFYAGGANGVRGWSVRTLGPGSFDSRNSVTDFINQCGDIRLDLSMEYRAKLFWVFEGAAFIDAGNVWTIHNYENQPGGMFHFSTFWKQIAMAYGVGLRLDFNYFLLRLDLGVKAYNPAMNQERWPLIHPRWKRDTAFHFSVGYPF